MARKPAAAWLIDDVADFRATCPSRDELLAYRPSHRAEERLSALLAKAKGSLTADEEWELRQFEYVEMLLQAVKARLRSRRTVP